jgi:hypothetical protein
MSLTIRLEVAGCPKCFPRASTAVTRSLICNRFRSRSPCDHFLHVSRTYPNLFDPATEFGAIPRLGPSRGSTPDFYLMTW